MKKIFLLIFSAFSLLLLISFANANSPQFVGKVTKVKCVNGKCVLMKKNLNREEARQMNIQMNNRMLQLRKQIEQRFLWFK